MGAIFIFFFFYHFFYQVLLNAVSKQTAKQCMTEMTPYMQEQAKGDRFLGKETLRAGAVMARSPASWEMASHPDLVGIVEGVLAHQVVNASAEDFPHTMQREVFASTKKHPTQIHLTQIIRRGPNDVHGAQPLHRDGGAFVFNFNGTIEPEVSTIWALNDFTPDNGPTR